MKIITLSDQSYGVLIAFLEDPTRFPLNAQNVRAFSVTRPEREP